MARNLHESENFELSEEGKRQQQEGYKILNQDQRGYHYLEWSRHGLVKGPWVSNSLEDGLVDCYKCDNKIQLEPSGHIPKDKTAPELWLKWKKPPDSCPQCHATSPLESKQFGTP